MTNESEQFQVEYAVGANDAYLQFGVPGVPYSAVRIPLVDDPVEAAAWITRALKAGEYLRRHYRETFGVVSPNEPFADEERSPFFEDAAPFDGVQVVIDPETHEARMPANGERVTGEQFACPDCGQPAKPSIEKYQEWEAGPDGRLYAQKFFCGNDRCATKSLWRSKLKPLQPSRA